MYQIDETPKGADEFLVIIYDLRLCIYCVQFLVVHLPIVDFKSLDKFMITLQFWLFIVARALEHKHARSVTAEIVFFKRWGFQGFEDLKTSLFFKNRLHSSEIIKNC